jgi:hypothetical protein
MKVCACILRRLLVYHVWFLKEAWKSVECFSRKALCSVFLVILFTGIPMSGVRMWMFSDQNAGLNKTLSTSKRRSTHFLLDPGE